MKAIFRAIFFVAAAALLLSSCAANDAPATSAVTTAAPAESAETTLITITTPVESAETTVVPEVTVATEPLPLDPKYLTVVECEIDFQPEEGTYAMFENAPVIHNGKVYYMIGITQKMAQWATHYRIMSKDIETGETALVKELDLSEIIYFRAMADYLYYYSSKTDGVHRLSLSDGSVTVIDIHESLLEEPDYIWDVGIGPYDWDYMYNRFQFSQHNVPLNYEAFIDSENRIWFSQQGSDQIFYLDPDAEYPDFGRLIHDKYSSYQNLYAYYHHDERNPADKLRVVIISLPELFSPNVRSDLY